MYKIDLKQFNKVQIPFVHPIYSGLGVFDDEKYHPVIKIKDNWYALTHTKSNNCVECNTTITGVYYGEDKIRQSYIIKCNTPKRVAKKIGGYIYLKPLFDFFKKYSTFNSIEELMV